MTTTPRARAPALDRIQSIQYLDYSKYFNHFFNFLIIDQQECSRNILNMYNVQKLCTKLSPYSLEKKIRYSKRPRTDDDSNEAESNPGSNPTTVT